MSWNTRNGTSSSSSSGGGGGAGQRVSLTSALTSAGIKAFSMSSGKYVYTPIVSLSGAGIVSKIWLAIAGPPHQVAMQIIVDGVLCIGNTATVAQQISPQLAGDGADTFALTVDRWGNNGIATSGNSTLFSNDIMGSNACNTVSFGGYVALDIPYGSSFVLALANTATSQTVSVFAQVFSGAIPASLNPYGPVRLHSTTFALGSANVGLSLDTGFYPVLSVPAGPNGVYLRGIKTSFLGVADATEGRWCAWQTPTQLGGSTTKNAAVGTLFPWTGFVGGQQYATGKTGVLANNVLNPPIAGSTLLLASTGYEDFFLSSYQWSNESTAGAGTLASSQNLNAGGNANPVTWNQLPTTTSTDITWPTVLSKLNNESGVLWSTAAPAYPGGSANAYANYRFFGLNDGVMPSVPANGGWLTFGFNYGDSVAVVGGAIMQNVYGIVYYYA